MHTVVYFLQQALRSSSGLQAHEGRLPGQVRRQLRRGQRRRVRGAAQGADARQTDRQLQEDARRQDHREMAVQAVRRAGPSPATTTRASPT